MEIYFHDITSMILRRGSPLTLSVLSSPRVMRCNTLSEPSASSDVWPAAASAVATPAVAPRAVATPAVVIQAIGENEGHGENNDLENEEMMNDQEPRQRPTRWRRCPLCSRALQPHVFRSRPNQGLCKLL